jgi:hypothetical protein
MFITVLVTRSTFQYKVTIEIDWRFFWVQKAKLRNVFGEKNRRERKWNKCTSDEMGHENFEEFPVAQYAIAWRNRRNERKNKRNKTVMGFSFQSMRSWNTDHHERRTGKLSAASRERYPDCREGASVHRCRWTMFFPSINYFLSDRPRRRISTLTPSAN